MNNKNSIIDFLTYKSWRAQVELYNMSFEDARKLYENAKSYEKIYIEEIKNENII